MISCCLQILQIICFQVSALVTNPRIPEQDRLQKIQDLYAKIPDSIKREFDSKFTNL